MFHAPIQGEVRRAVSDDVNAIWGRQFSFLEKAEYRGFLFSAEYLFIAAKYIIGIAAFISQDVNLALRLHEGLVSDLDRIAFNPNHVRINRRVRTLISEEHALIARTQPQVEEMRRHLTESLEWDPHNYSAHLFKAIIEFVYDKDPRQALQTINTCAGFANKDGTWRYSKGFLLMYLDECDKALLVYRDIARNSFEGEDSIIRQVEDFNIQRLEIEPDKIQSLFILGYVKYRKRKDYSQALSYFDQFLERADGNRKFQTLIAEANVYKTQLQDLIAQED